VASAPFATSYRWHENSNTPHKPCPLSLGNLRSRIGLSSDAWTGRNLV